MGKIAKGRVIHPVPLLTLENHEIRPANLPVARLGLRLWMVG